MQVKITKKAEHHLENGYLFYEDRQLGLGTYFLDSLYSDIDSLAIFGGIHAKHLGAHRLIASKFPFAVYYKIKDNIAFVVSVLNCRRSPAWIKNKLNEH